MEAPTALEWVVAAAAMISVATNCRLFLRHIDGRPLLAYEPRRPVPWSGAAPFVVLVALPLIAYALSRIAARDEQDPLAAAVQGAAEVSTAAAPGLAGVEAGEAVAAGVGAIEAPARAEQYIRNVWGAAGTNILLAAAVQIGLIAVYSANRRDLGWPSGGRQLAGDVKIGAVAWAASLLPVYAVQFMLIKAFEPEQMHPLIEQYVANPSSALALAAGASAVVAAPLFEESAFRMLLQGWLEKLDAAVRGRPSSESPPTTADAPRASWSPIVISGLVFGVAHYGQGVAPVSLVLLGFILGYVYQRTHRIVPCIVCHLLFNAFSLLLLSVEVNRQLGP